MPFQLSNLTPPNYNPRRSVCGNPGDKCIHYEPPAYMRKHCGLWLSESPGGGFEVCQQFNYKKQCPECMWHNETAVIEQRRTLVDIKTKAEKLATHRNTSKARRAREPEKVRALQRARRKAQRKREPEKVRALQRAARARNKKITPAPPLENTIEQSTSRRQYMREYMRRRRATARDRTISDKEKPQ